MALLFRLKANTSQPSEQCLQTLQGVLNAVEKYVEVVGPEGSSFVIISENEPSVDDRDKLWIRLESSGAPRGTFAWNGDEWEMVPALPKKGTFGDGTGIMVMFFSGKVADIPTGWHLCDGLDGSPDYTSMSAGDYPEIWKPNYNIATTQYDLCPIAYIGQT